MKIRWPMRTVGSAWQRRKNNEGERTALGDAQSQETEENIGEETENGKDAQSKNPEDETGTVTARWACRLAKCVISRYCSVVHCS